MSEALDTSPNYLLLGFDGTEMEEKWIEDIVQVLKKITEPPYRELALNQLKCIVNMVAWIYDEKVLKTLYFLANQKYNISKKVGGVYE